MKKKLLFFIAVFVITIFLGTSSGYAAYKFFANDISFNPENKDWNVKNVDEALNTLYEKKLDSTTLVEYINNGIPMSEGLVPKLSSNIGDNGEAFSNTPIYGANYEAWKAFNHDLTGNDKQNWASYVMTGNYGYIGYKFNNPQKVNTFYLNTLKNDNNIGVCITKFVLQASNDGETWVDLTEEISHPAKTIKYYNVTKNEGNYTYYRIYGSSAGAGSLISIHELQFFNY